jgi:hypothetical protein
MGRQDAVGAELHLARPLCRRSEMVPRALASCNGWSRIPSIGQQRLPAI